MNVSPLDLRQQKFRTAFRGFDPVEVSSFLLAVADDDEQSLRETDRRRQEVARLEMVVRGHVEQEKSLQNTAETSRRRDLLDASIQTLRNTLEFVREQDARDREERLLSYRPRLVEPEAKTG